MPAIGESNAAANHQRILLHLLNSVDENKYCCDCDAKGPRWASWNLGLFLCIRCAGIHRKLGVHISKVKSVNLDSWNAEQIESVLRMGNKKAREIYEAKLPPGHRRPQEDYALEQFITNKYDKKMYADTQKLKDTNFEKVDINKYIATISGVRPRTTPNRGSGGIPAPPSSASSAEKPAESPHKGEKDNFRNTTHATATPTNGPPKPNVDELLNFGSPPTVVSQRPQEVVTSAVNSSTTSVAAVKTDQNTVAGASGFSNTASTSSDLAGLVFDPAQNNGAVNLFNQNNSAGGDLFTSNFESEDEASNSSSTCGKKTNQDILSLYKTAASSSTNAFSSGGFSTGANILPSSAYQWNNQSTNTPNAFTGQQPPHNSFSPQPNFSGAGFNANGNMIHPPADFFNRNSTLIGQPPSQVAAAANYTQGAFTSQFNQMNLGPGSNSFGQGMSAAPLIQSQHHSFNSMPQTNSTYSNPFAHVSAPNPRGSGGAGLHLPSGANSGIFGQGQHSMGQTAAHNWNASGFSGNSNSFGSFSNTSGSFAAPTSPGMINGNSSFGMGAAGMGSHRPPQMTHQSQSPNMFTPFQSQQQTMISMNNNNFPSPGGINNPSAPSFNPYHSTSQQQQSLWLK